MMRTGEGRCWQQAGVGCGCGQMAAALSARLGQLGTQQALPGRRADQGLGPREGASPRGGGGLQVRGRVTGPPPRPLRPSRPAVLWEHSPVSGEDNSLVHEHTRAPARQPLPHTSLLITAGASLTLQRSARLPAAPERRCGHPRPRLPFSLGARSSRGPGQLQGQAGQVKRTPGPSPGRTRRAAPQHL